MDFTFKNCIKIKNFKRKIIAPFKLMLKKRDVAGFGRTNKQKATW